MAKKVEVNTEEYRKIAEEIVSGISGEKERTAVVHLLSGGEAMKTYGILRANEIPYTTIRRVMAHSLNNFQKGRGLTIGSYALGIAEELTHYEGYADVVSEMYKEGILKEKQYNEVQGTIVGHIKKGSERLRHGLSELERMTGVAAAIFGISGIGLLIASGMRITGNVVGNSAGNLSGGLAGIVLLVVSLFLFWRSFKN